MTNVHGTPRRNKDHAETTRPVADDTTGSPIPARALSDPDLRFFARTLLHDVIGTGPEPLDVGGLANLLDIHLANTPEDDELLRLLSLPDEQPLALHLLVMAALLDLVRSGDVVLGHRAGALTCRATRWFTDQLRATPTRLAAPDAPPRPQASRRHDPR